MVTGRKAWVRTWVTHAVDFGYSFLVGFGVSMGAWGVIATLTAVHPMVGFGVSMGAWGVDMGRARFFGAH